MNALQELKLEQELKGAVKREPEYQWTQTELKIAWRSVSAPVLHLAEALANLPDSVEAIAAFQQVIPPELSDLATMSANRLRDLGRGLRIAWTALDDLGQENKKLVRGEAQSILHNWWSEHPLKDGQHWNIYYQTGTFFPTRKNYHAILARVCFDNRDFLGVCRNPDCKKFFIKKRRIAKYCTGCYAYDNNERQRKSRAAKAARKNEKVAQK